MELNIENVGLVAVGLACFSLIPQIYLIVKHKNAKSVSYLTYFINIISSILLIIYASYLKLFPIFIGNTMLLFTSIIILILKHKYS